MPGELVKVAFGYGNDSRVRGENQDALGVFEVGDTVLGVICDGVGGHSGGQQAATLAVRTVAESLQEGATDLQRALVEAITVANRAIYETGRKSHRLMGMSTTIVAVAIRDDIAVVAHVGDSRAYLVRDGVAQALTRDHTMVNMFVDNDLLSAEDAASHPEAHVLARSLGSERQVDIDVQPIIHLQDGDNLVLCSDGVHNNLSDADLAHDWIRPGLTARQLLRKVAAHGGKDGASIIGFRIGGRGEPGMVFTPIPSIEQSGDALTPSSSDMVQAPNLLEEPMPPALYPIEPEDEPTHYTEDPGSSVGGMPLVSREPTPRPVPRTPVAPPPRPEQQDKAGKKGPSRAVLIAGGAAVLCLLILGASAVYRFVIAPPGEAVAANDTAMPATTPAPPPTPVPVAVEPSTTGVGQALIALDDTDEPLISPGSAVLDDPPSADAYSVANIDLTAPTNAWVYVAFPELRANEKTKVIYDTPPASAQHRVNISKIVHGTNPDCAAVEEIVTRAIRSSGDNAPLFEDLWHCFQDAHHAALEGPVAAHHDFGRIKRHLEGNPTQPSAKATLPYWYLPATDGIERRMDLFAEHAISKNRGAIFDDVVLDAIDREIIAATLSHDLQTEAAFARGFRRLRNPRAGEIQQWARRVYTVRRHLDSPVGELVKETYSEAWTRTLALLRDATFDFERAYTAERKALALDNESSTPEELDWQQLAMDSGLEAEVARALLVAAGQLPNPSLEPIKKEEDKPKKPTGPPPSRDPSKIAEGIIQD